MTAKRWIAITVLALMVAACGDDGSVGAGGSSTTADPTTTTITPAASTSTPEVAGKPFEIVNTGEETNTGYVGNFAASGPAVDDGLICTAGHTTDHNWQNLGNGQELLDTEFICDDGTGSFTLATELVGTSRSDAWTAVGTWTVLEGTGAYEALTGNGTLEGECPVPVSSCQDLYQGELSITN